MWRCTRKSPAAVKEKLLLIENLPKVVWSVWGDNSLPFPVFYHMPGFKHKGDFLTPAI